MGDFILNQFINNRGHCGSLVWAGVTVGDDEAVQGGRLTLDLLQPLQVELGVWLLGSEHLTHEDAIAEHINLGGVG